ncbi:MAG: hypothetical protein AAFV36_00310 [Myxococcota bacterium]
MSTPQHVNNEIAYDLLQDHLELILTMIERPMSRDELIRRVGSPRVASRLVDYGLVRATNQGMQASSSTFQQVRQEGMVAFLERYVLPSLASDPTGETTLLVNRYLTLGSQRRLSMLRGPVQTFFEHLSEATDAPLQGESARLSVLVVGSSRVHADVAPEERSLCHLSSASELRAVAATRDQAVVSQFDCLADLNRAANCRRLIDGFVSSFDASESEAGRADYHLTVASHWRKEFDPGAMQ